MNEHHNNDDNHLPQIAVRFHRKNPHQRSHTFPPRKKATDKFTDRSFARNQLKNSHSLVKHKNKYPLRTFKTTNTQCGPCVQNSYHHHYNHHRDHRGDSFIGIPETLHSSFPHDLMLISKEDDFKKSSEDLYSSREP